MATIEVKVPDIGDFKDVAVIELLVKPGDRVAVDQSLITSRATRHRWTFRRGRRHRQGVARQGR